MAKTKNDKELEKALNNAIEDLLKDYRSAMTEAVKYAVAQAKKDYMKKAKSCLEEYYANYDPTNQYDRTETLQYAFLPYELTNYGMDKITGSVGVEYSPEILEQFIPAPTYYIGQDGVRKIRHEGYYGSSKHQPVDVWWVIDNYLKGIHPYTDGGTAYYEIYDAVSPNQKMDGYTKEYSKTFDANVLGHLLTQITKKMS